jgi:hypothetical protein
MITGPPPKFHGIRDILYVKPGVLGGDTAGWLDVVVLVLAVGGRPGSRNQDTLSRCGRSASANPLGWPR